jgi:hypothetical protein
MLTEYSKVNYVVVVLLSPDPLVDDAVAARAALLSVIVSVPFVCEVPDDAGFAPPCL